MKEVILELAREISLWSSFSLVAIREGRPEDLEEKDALQWHQGELEKNPNDKSLWYAMGTLLAKKGLCDEAVEAFGRVTSLDPLHLKAWDAKAKAFVRLERDQEALEAFDRATELQTGDERIWSQKGEALLKLGRLREALDCFDRAIEIDSNFSDAWYGRGQALREIEKQPDAGIVQEPRVKTQNEDDQENAESETASTLHSTVPSDQDGSDHFPDESERSEIGPEDGADENDYLLAANVQRYAGNTDGALRLYDEAIRINPDFLDAWYAKGTLLYILDRYREALECLDKVLLLNPDHEWARKRKAQIEILTNSTKGSEKTSPDDVEEEETRGEEDGAARPDLTVVRAFRQSWDRIS
ncbi:MAG: tetratricopeptide repeat protein, partial [Thermoplasmata archaeon]